ncbi:hypothetical protein ACS0TY_003370 [Phlomoides rotata]
MKKLEWLKADLLNNQSAMKSIPMKMESHLTMKKKHLMTMELNLKVLQLGLFGMWKLNNS